MLKGPAHIQASLALALDIALRDFIIATNAPPTSGHVAAAACEPAEYGRGSGRVNVALNF